MQKGKGAVWVVAEQIEGKLAESSFELLGKAAELAAQGGGAGVVSVVMGSGIGALAEELIPYGAERVLVIDHPRLMLYQNDTYAAVLEDLIRRESPEIVLFSASYCGSELSATVAAKLGTGLAAHCVDLHINEQGEFVQVVPAFGGRVLGDILCPNHRPQMASVKPGLFPKPAKDAIRIGEVVKETAAVLDGFSTPLKALRVVQETPPGLPLEQADVVVAGGWGVGSAETWHLLEELARQLGGAVGCTRPALDEGWTEGEHTMIGTSGKTVRPRLYIGFGISGAAHHVVGMKDSGVVISVNNDSQAPIFQVSDYGIVADLKKILPPLLEEIKAHKDSGT